MNLVQKFGLVTLCAISFAQASFGVTVYFLVEADGSDVVVDPTNDKAMVLGKPGGTMTPSTGYSGSGGSYAVKCGSYQSDSNEGDVTASSHFNTTLNETWVAFASSNNSKGARIPRSMMWVGTRPDPATRISSITLYKENATYDTGACYESGTGKWYHKYTANAD